MSVATRSDWLEAGFRILIQQGAADLTVEALCRRLQRTKGSFYHHFKGIDGYTQELLTYFEAVGTLNVISEVEQEPTAEQQLTRLIEFIVNGAGELEIAMRAWALQDERVRLVQERIDQRRIAYVEALWHELLDDPAQARTLSEMLYALLVGAGFIVPGLSQKQLAAVYTEALRSWELGPFFQEADQNDSAH